MLVDQRPPPRGSRLIGRRDVARKADRTQLKATRCLPSGRPWNYLCFLGGGFVFLRIPLLDETQTCNFIRPSSGHKCLKEASGQRESLQKLTGILLVRVVRAERRRQSEIYSTCTSTPSAGSHLERGSTRPTATVGTACVYLFIPAAAAPAISARRFPNAASRHMTQQPSVHLAGMRALPSLRANRRARIPSAISLIGRLIQFWPRLISFLERRC